MFLTRKKMVLRFTLCSTTKFDDGTKCESYHKQHNPIHNIQFIKRTEFGGSRARGRGERTICLRRKNHIFVIKNIRKKTHTLFQSHQIVPKKEQITRKQRNPIRNIQFIKRTEFGGSRARGKGEKTICLRKKSHFC